MQTIGLEQVLANAATGLSAQSIRMNTIASNIANAGNVGNSEESTYHTHYPMFKEISGKAFSRAAAGDMPTAGVQVTKIEHSKAPLDTRYEPSNPMANEQGYVYVTDVNPVAEMTNMISASKDYQANIEVINTIKSMMTQTANQLNYK